MSVTDQIMQLRAVCRELSALIVDDDAKLAENYAALAERFFKEVTVITSPTEVQEIYAAKRFDIIYTDINMPGMSGIELIRQIRAINPEQAFIVLSGSNEARNLMALLEIGISTFILKPFVIERFLRATFDLASSIVQMRSIKDEAKLVKEELSLAQEAQERQESMLIQQSKLAQTGEMISMIAHQWRQPLAQTTALIAKFSTRRELGIYEGEEYTKAKLLDEVDEMMQKIERSTLHLSKTINDFRDFYRPEKMRVEFNLNQAIRDTVSISMLEDAMEVGFHLCEDTQAVVYGYEGEFKQILLNLFNNARDVLIEREITEPKLEIRTVADDEQTIIDIIDNAGGIPDGLEEKIFMPYFSTKSKKHGTGIGLHMVKTIIEKHFQGSVGVHNTAAGADFTITLKKETQKEMP